MKTIALTFLLFASFYGACQSNDVPMNMANGFFTSYMNDGIDEALDELYNGHPWRNEINGSIQAISNEFKKLTPDLLGECYGASLISNDDVSDCYSELVFFLKFERQPFVVVFTFYKPDSKWQILNFELREDL